MRYYILLITMFFMFSCGNEKVLHLPEVSHSEITDIKDVSHAYIFYDETKTDSVELNRKNLISTTNWLINVDKRLTLKQAIPYIKYLQDKKANSSHKNETAKNYFTCNDTSRKNLGFIEFTDVEYILRNIEKGSSPLRPPMTYEESKKHAPPLGFIILPVIIKDDNNIILHDKLISLNQFQKELIIFQKKHNFIGIKLEFYFNKNIKFQDYIEIKTRISELQLDLVIFDNNEYIY